MSGGRGASPMPSGSSLPPVALIHSPHAGSAGRADPVALLRGAGLEVIDATPITKLSRLNPTRLVARWRKAGARAVIAAGGDGSVGAVATLASQADMPLGILPLGTSNDIARALALPVVHAEAARLIAHCLATGETREIDAGELAPAPGAPTSPSGLFLHALALGLNVEFARLATDPSQRQRWGALTYAASAVASLSHYTPIPVTLTVEGIEGQPEGATETITASIAMLAAINLPVFGGRLELRLPAVREDDRLLDFILIEALSPPDLMRLSSVLDSLFTARNGSARQAGATNGGSQPGWRRFRARSVTITTPEPVEITLDGELRGHTPAIARVAARPVRVLARRATL